MRRSNLQLSRAAFTAALLFAVPLFAANPPKPATPAAKPAAAAKPYHIELEANPAAPFPYLSKFGTVKLHVYPSGVRAESAWMNGFSKDGSNAITVLNPTLKMYFDVPIDEIGNMLAKLGGMSNPKSYNAIATVEPPVRERLNGIDVSRYRARYTQTAWIDIWTTTAVPDNAQLQKIVNQIVYNISPGTGALTRFIPGVPVRVELNFTNYKKVALVTLKSMKMDATGESAALSTPESYTKAPMIEEMWK